MFPASKCSAKITAYQLTENLCKRGKYSVISSCNWLHIQQNNVPCRRTFQNTQYPFCKCSRLHSATNLPVGYLTCPILLIQWTTKFGTPFSR